MKKCFTLKGIAKAFGAAVLAMSLSLSCTIVGVGGGSGTGSGGGNSSGGSGGSDGSSASSTLQKLKNTTWLFENIEKKVTGICPVNHNDGSSGGTGTGGETPVACIHTINKVKKGSEHKTEERNRDNEDLYLHIDSEYNAYMGTVEYTETYTKEWDEVTYVNITTCNQNPSHNSEGVPFTEEENIKESNKNIGPKEYTPLVKGILKDSKTSGKVEFLYSYIYTYEVEKVSYESVPAWVCDMNSSVTDKLKEVDFMTSDGKYFQLTPEMSGSTVKFVCPSDTVVCGVVLASGRPCQNRLVTKKSSNWNKEEYNAAMIGPEHNPKAVYTLLKANGWYKADLNKDSASAENYDDFIFPKPKEGSSSECLKISSETKLKLSTASSEYWGENCFYMDEENSNEYGWSVVGSGVDRKLVITKEPGVYELHNLYFKDDKIISICKPNSSTIPPEGFNSLPTEAINWEYLPVDFIATKSIYGESSYFASNPYIYKKNLSEGAQWYRQCAVWKGNDLDNNEMTFECYDKETRNGHNDMYKYKITYLGKTFDIVKVGDLGDDKYIVFGKAFDETPLSFIITDTKKADGLKVKSGSSEFAITYQSRYEYNESNLVDVTLTGDNVYCDADKFSKLSSIENTGLSTNMAPYDYTVDSDKNEYVIKLPKTLKVEKVFGWFNVISKELQDGTNFEVKDSHTGSVIDKNDSVENHTKIHMCGKSAKFDVVFQIGNDSSLFGYMFSLDHKYQATFIENYAGRWTISDDMRSITITDVSPTDDIQIILRCLKYVGYEMPASGFKIKIGDGTEQNVSIMGSGKISMSTYNVTESCTITITGTIAGGPGM